MDVQKEKILIEKSTLVNISEIDENLTEVLYITLLLI